MGKGDSSGVSGFVLRIDFQFLSAGMFGWPIETAAWWGWAAAGPVRRMFNDWPHKLRAFWRDREAREQRKGMEKKQPGTTCTCTIMKPGYQVLASMQI